MIPAAASPSLMLPNPAAPIGGSVAATDAGAAPDAALSGFELLLGAMQQLQQKLPTSAGENDTAAKNPDKTTGDSGNALPQLGMILPSLALSPTQTQAQTQPQAQPQTQPQTTEKNTAKVAASSQLDAILPSVESAEKVDVLPQLGATQPAAALLQPQIAAKLSATGSEAVDGKAKDAKDKDAKDKDVDVAATDTLPTIAVLSPVVSGFVIAPPQAATAVVSSDAVGLDLVSAGASADLIAAPGVVRDSAVKDSVAKDKGDRTGSASRVETPMGGTGVAAGSADNAVTTAGAKDLQGASMSPAESDFDALVKHLNAPTPTQLPAVNNVGDSPSTQQASRSYVDAASSGASVSVPVGGSGWSDAVADKVLWFSANKISSAEIHLNPPDLGPLQVRVSMQHDQASVVFTSQHAAVRDALDQALPRLREMMGNQGMHLLDVSVGGQSAQQQQQQQFTRNDSDRGAPSGGFFADDSAETGVATVTTVNTSRLQRSGIDAYA